MPIGMGRPNRNPRGPVSWAVPTGTCQAMRRVFKSMAVRVPKGGCTHGTPSLDNQIVV